MQTAYYRPRQRIGARRDQFGNVQRTQPAGAASGLGGATMLSNGGPSALDAFQAMNPHLRRASDGVLGRGPIQRALGAGLMAAGGAVDAVTAPQPPANTATTAAGETVRMGGSGLGTVEYDPRNDTELNSRSAIVPDAFDPMKTRRQITTPYGTGSTAGPDRQGPANPAQVVDITSQVKTFDSGARMRPPTQAQASGLYQAGRSLMPGNVAKVPPVPDPFLIDRSRDRRPTVAAPAVVAAKRPAPSDSFDMDQRYPERRGMTAPTDSFDRSGGHSPSGVLGDLAKRGARHMARSMRMAY